LLKKCFKKTIIIIFLNLATRYFFFLPKEKNLAIRRNGVVTKEKIFMTSGKKSCGRCNYGEPRFEKSFLSGDNIFVIVSRILFRDRRIYFSEEMFLRDVNSLFCWRRCVFSFRRKKSNNTRPFLRRVLKSYVRKVKGFQEAPFTWLG